MPVDDTPGNYLREPAGAPIRRWTTRRTSRRRCAIPSSRSCTCPHTITEITGPALGDARADHARGRRSDQPARGRHRSASGSPSPAACSTPRASRCATRWWRSGRPTPPGATCTAGTTGRRRWTPTSPEPGAASPTTRGAIGSSPSSPGRTRGATTTTRGDRPTSTSRSWGGPSPSGSSPRCTSPATRSSPMTPSSTRSATSRPAERMISRFSIHGTQPELGAGVRVRHLPARPGGDTVRGGAVIFGTTPSQTVGPYFAIGLPWPEGPHAVAEGTPGAFRSAAPSTTARARRSRTT